MNWEYSKEKIDNALTDRPFYEVCLRILEWVVSLGVIAYAEQVSDSWLVSLLYAIGLILFGCYLGHEAGRAALYFIPEDVIMSRSDTKLSQKKPGTISIAIIGMILVNLALTTVVTSIASAEALDDQNQKSIIDRTDRLLLKLEAASEHKNNEKPDGNTKG